MKIQGQDQHTMEQVPEDAVGRQVLCDGERATVRYVGTVPPTTGEIWSTDGFVFPYSILIVLYRLNSLQSRVPLWLQYRFVFIVLSKKIHIELLCTIYLFFVFLLLLLLLVDYY